MGGRTAAPFPPASLSGEGLEGGVAAVPASLENRPAMSLPGGVTSNAWLHSRLKFVKLDI